MNIRNKAFTLSIVGLFFLGLFIVGIRFGVINNIVALICMPIILVCVIINITIGLKFLGKG